MAESPNNMHSQSSQSKYRKLDFSHCLVLQIMSASNLGAIDVAEHSTRLAVCGHMSYYCVPWLLRPHASRICSD